LPLSALEMQAARRAMAAVLGAEQWGSAPDRRSLVFINGMESGASHSWDPPRVNTWVSQQLNALAFSIHSSTLKHSISSEYLNQS